MQLTSPWLRRAPLVALTCLLPAGCAQTPQPPRLVDSLQEPYPGEEPPHETRESGEPYEPSQGSQAVGVFLGGATSSSEESGFVTGLEYGYRLTESVGIGAFAENVSGSARSFSAGAQAFWVLPQKFVLFAGLGAEEREDEWGTLWRTGIEYEWCMPSGWVIAPSLFYDIGEEDNLLVFGVTFGRFL